MARSYDMALQSDARVAPSEPPATAARANTPTGTSVSDFNVAQTIGDVVTGGDQDGVSATYDPVDREVDFLNTDKGTVAVAAHVALPDPHGDRAYSDAQLAAHTVAADPHGDRAFAAAADAAHVAAADPHTQYVLESQLPELVDDEVNTLLVGDMSVTKTYNDAGNSLTLRLVNDTTTPDNLAVYGTDAAGVKGWYKPSLFESTGVLLGGALTINGTDNTKFDMASGLYGFVDYTVTPATPTRSLLTKAAVTSQTVTNLATAIATYIGVDSAGVIQQSTTPFTNTQRRTICQVGVLVHSNHVNLNAINDTAAPARHGIAQVHDLMNALGPMNILGNTVSANGANLSINKTSGQVFKVGSTFQATPLNPHLISLASLTAPATLRYRTSTGTETANTAVLDPTQYESSPGVLTTLSNANRFSVQRVNLFTSNLIRLQWGQAEYATLADAEAAIATQQFNTETNIAENGVLIGHIILRRSTTALNNATDAKFIGVGKFGNASASSAGAIPGTTDALAEGVVNLYYTDARARAAVITSAITNGDTTHSPSGDAVFDAFTAHVAAADPHADRAYTDTQLAAHVAAADPHTQYVKIASLSELVDDRVAALMVAGTGVTLTYDDVLNTLTVGVVTPANLSPGAFLTGTAYNGSVARTFAVDATSANTVSKVVARDASGNFSAGTITAALTGNATTATTAAALTTPRTIALSGGATGTATSFSGAANITIPVTALDAPSLTGTVAAARLSGTYAIDVTGASSLNVLKSGDTMTGALTISGLTNPLAISVATGNATGFLYQTSGSTRWRFGKGSGAEAGGNAGSDFFIQNYDDTGTAIATPLTIVRSTGAVSIGSGGLDVNGTLMAGATTIGAALMVSYTSPEIGIATAAATQTSSLYFYNGGTAAANRRWRWAKNNVAESGSNVGANLELRAHDDSGAQLSIPITITRSTGDVQLAAKLGVTGVTTFSADVQGVTATFSGAIAIGGSSTVGSNQIGLRGMVRTTATTINASSSNKCHAVTVGVTIPASTMAAGDEVWVYNNSGAAITLTQDTGLTIRLSGTATTGNRTLAQRGMARIWFNSPTDCVIDGQAVT